MEHKPSILVYDLGGCEGCPLSILRVYPELKKIADLYTHHLGKIDLDKEYDVAVITGPICINEPEDIDILKKIRTGVRTLIAYGSCASVGGITLFCRGGQEPRPEHRTFQPISAIINVDYAIPGCPPAPNLFIALVNSLRSGRGYFLQLFASVAKAKRLSGFDLLDNIVLTGLCISCGACIISCPTNALHMIDRKPDLIVEKCIRCGTCCVRCPRFTQVLVQKYALKKEVV